MATDLAATSLPLNGRVTVAAAAWEEFTLPATLHELWVYLDQDSGLYPTGLVSYTGGADTGIVFPAKVWTRVWKRHPAISTQGVSVHIKAGAAGQTLHYSDAVQVGGQGDIEVNVDLDPATDGVTVWGSDDGGTTPRILLTDSTGAQVAVGAAATGGAAAGNPVLIAGIDGSGNVLPPTVTADGLEVAQSDATKLLVTEASAAGIKIAVELLDDAVAAFGALLGTLKGIVVQGSDGTNVRPLKTDAGGELQVDVLSSALPSGAATAVDQGKAAAAAKKSGSVAHYAGVEIEVTGLTASSPYDLLAPMYQLVGGTSGNTTQPSLGEATGFTQGGIDDRWKASAARCAVTASKPGKYGA